MRIAQRTMVALLTVLPWQLGLTARGAPALDGSAAFTNPGVYHESIDGLLYEWIPTQDVNFQIRPGGEVRIVAPLTKRSFDGRTECRRFLYDHLHRRVDSDEEQALFGDGLRLPPGNYGFAIQWVNAKTYDEVRGRSVEPDEQSGKPTQAIRPSSIISTSRSFL